MTHRKSEQEPLNLTCFNLLNGKPRGWLLQTDAVLEPSRLVLCFRLNSTTGHLTDHSWEHGRVVFIVVLRPSLTCIILAGLELVFRLVWPSTHRDPPASVPPVLGLRGWYVPLCPALSNTF